MKTIFYSKEAQFELTDEEYQKALVVWNKGQKAFISRLNVSLSPLYIWAGEKPQDPNRKRIEDGWAVKKYGQWVDERTEVKLDMNYYGWLNDPNKEINPKRLKQSNEQN